MISTPGYSALRLIILFFISTLLVSCGGSENAAQDYPGAGITYRLSWPVAKSVGSAPVGVVTVRMSVSGPGMTTISKDFAASAGTGSIDNVPVGSGRTITFQGFDSDLILKYQAAVSNVTLVSEKTYNCGLIPMEKAGTAIPAVPTGLSASAASFSQINLVWADNASDETGYKVERKTGAGGTYAQIGVVAANVTTYSDTALSDSTTYYYRVFATNGFGDSYSNEAGATTPVITYSITGSINIGGAALAGVTVTLSGSGSTSTTTNSGGNYSFSGAENGNYTLTPAMAGYSFNPVSLPVTVAGGDMASMNFSAAASTAPAAPSGLGATAVSSSRVNLAWVDNANNEAGYRIERKAGVAGTYVQIDTAVANATTYSDFSLSAATDYYYRVRATNGFGDSGYSNEAHATTFGTATLITPELVKVIGGTFTMGGTSQTTVGDYYIGRYEVTQREWSAVMVSNPSKFPACGLDCPVESVSWNDVQVFITELNRLSGKSYRLPTEAEWEYAARSGGLDQIYSGGSDVNAVAWYAGNSGGMTHRVGLKQANGLGIYDMSGNAVEWVNDLYDSSNRVMRGGSWFGSETVQRTTFRAYYAPNLKNEYLGFRLAITTP